MLQEVLVIFKFNWRYIICKINFNQKDNDNKNVYNNSDQGLDLK